MNQLDSELEEGEILDDSPAPSPSPRFNNNRRKELPERYIVRDNITPTHKHRKGCRHAIRHHAKKLSKLKKTPTKKKNSPKWHHKPSCTYEKSHRVLDRYNGLDKLKNVFPKNGSFSQNSLIAEMKGSLKNAPPFTNLHSNLDKPRSQQVPCLKQNFKSSYKDFAISGTSSAKILRSDVNNSMANNVSTNSEYLAGKINSNDYLIEDDESSDTPSIIEISVPDSIPPLIDLSNSPDNSPAIIDLDSSNDVKNVANTVSNNLLQIKDEESEDEEELRRIALATFAKRKILKESESTIQNIDYPCNIPVPDLSDINVQISHQVTNNPTADNYEVVDMEVDEEDMQDSLETIQTSFIDQKSKSAENLFVIDARPSNDFLQNKSNSPSAPQAAGNSDDDDDFEANILRAELINSMYRKKAFEEDSKEESNITVHEKQIPVVQQKRPLVNHQKTNLQFCYKRLKSAKHFLRKRSVNKLVNINNINNNNKSISNNKKTPLPAQASKPSERLIITVNGESSDDSDNSDEETNTVSENPVDSIVALISDCRQKSASSTESKEKEALPKAETVPKGETIPKVDTAPKVESIPKALSCLSKAQQEEYNKLMRILAKKEKLPVAQGTLSAKNGSVHSPSDDLKKLEKKLVLLRGALENKKGSMATLSEEVNSKKLHYMKAKLTAQHLKEQLVAAEKVRKAKLLEWSKTCDSLKLMKQSVSELENKMNEVQNLCSKIGSSLQGQSYKLPLSSGNEQS